MNNFTKKDLRKFERICGRFFLFSNIFLKEVFFDKEHEALKGKIDYTVKQLSNFHKNMSWVIYSLNCDFSLFTELADKLESLSDSLHEIRGILGRMLNRDINIRVRENSATGISIFLKNIDKIFEYFEELLVKYPGAFKDGRDRLEKLRERL